jgi:hypothetical protein
MQLFGAEWVLINGDSTEDGACEKDRFGKKKYRHFLLAER